MYVMNHTSPCESCMWTNHFLTLKDKKKRQQWAEPQDGWKYIIPLVCVIRGQKPSCSGLYCTTTDWGEKNKNKTASSIQGSAEPYVARRHPPTPADAHRRCHCCVTKPLNISFLRRDSTSETPIAQTNDLSLRRWKTVTRDVCDCFCFLWAALRSLACFVPRVCEMFLRFVLKHIQWVKHVLKEVSLITLVSKSWKLCSSCLFSVKIVCELKVHDETKDILCFFFCFVFFYDSRTFQMAMGAIYVSVAGRTCSCWATFPPWINSS